MRVPPPTSSAHPPPPPPPLSLPLTLLCTGIYQKAVFILSRYFGAEEEEEGDAQTVDKPSAVRVPEQPLHQLNFGLGVAPPTSSDSEPEDDEDEEDSDADNANNLNANPFG
jgi:hypothetical protein